MKKLIVLLVIASIGYGGYAYYKNREGLARVTIGNKSYDVEVATTFEARTQGLMNRDTIGVADGMLFVFEKPGIYPFWMKDVRFPLDIIWIMNDRVVYVVESAEPSPEPPYNTYTPTEVANFVLELPRSTVLRDGIQVGAEVEIEI